MRIDVKSSFYAGDRLLYIGEAAIKPGAPIEDWTIETLERELDLSVISYIQTGATRLHPDPDLRITAGCCILALASLETLHRLVELSQP
jgi:Trk K+ transport system NAD-binding subunit